MIVSSDRLLILSCGFSTRCDFETRPSSPTLTKCQRRQTVMVNPLLSVMVYFL